MIDIERLREALLSRPGVLLASLGLGIVLLSVGWLDNRAARRDLFELLESHAASVQATVAAAAQANQQARELAVAQVAARVRDNARLLARLDRTHPLDEATVAAIAADNDLFRVMVFAADGSREFAVMPAGASRGPGPGAGGPGPGPAAGGGQRAGRVGPGGGSGAGPGPGVATLVSRVLDQGEEEVVGDLHAGRRPGAARLAVAVRRPRGGAILVHADATAVLTLEQQASLDRLLEDIVSRARDVAYVVVTTPDGQHAVGLLPAEVDNLPAATTPVTRRDLAGQPILEFASTSPGGQTPATLIRIGMRLDELQRLEQRFLWRQVTGLATALILGGLALGLVWLRTRYGALAEAHARAREALERRDRLAAMGELASTVAHEIRNPLNAIAMSAQRLEREAFTGDHVDEDARGLLSVIRREADRINTRIHQFLAFARPKPLDRRRIPLAPWLEGIMEGIRPAAALKHLAVTVDADRAGEAVVDPEQLQQVLDNLLRNALEATPAGGRVEVRATSSRREHRIIVRDTGAGIAPDVLPRIFDLYFTTKADGTGVGLAVAQQIVTAHGGRIEVDSVPGQGTTFTVVLPAQP